VARCSYRHATIACEGVLLRILSVSLLILATLEAACSSSGSTAGSGSCAGTPPLVCDGCCGSKRAADSCVAGTWTCPPTVSCPTCDAGTDDAGIDATSGCSTDSTGTTILVTLDPFPDGPSSFEFVYGFAADTTAVYAVIQISDLQPDGASTERTEVLRVPLDCTPATILGSRSTDPSANGVRQTLLADGRVYIAMSDGIYSISTAGGAFTTEATTTPLQSGNGAILAVTNDRLAWIDQAESIWVAAKGGGQAPMQLAGPPEASAVLTWTSLAMDGTSVYATYAPALPPQDFADAATYGTVVAIPVAGGDAVTLASGQQLPGQIMVGNGSLYWTNSYPIPTVDTSSAHGPLMQLALPSGTATVLDPDETQPTQLTLRGSTLVWIDYGGPNGGDVIRELAPSGTPTTVQTPLVIGLGELTLGPAGAFWTAGSTDIRSISFP
jgi:hypothetical protein